MGDDPPVAAAGDPTPGDDAVTDLSDLPDHPRGRVVPGYSPAGRQLVLQRLRQAVRSDHGRLYGCVVAAAGTAHVFAEDAAQAARSAAHQFPAGDLRSCAADTPSEVDALDTGVDPDRLVPTYYSADDAEWPAFEVSLVGGGRFYTLAADPAIVGQVVPRVVDPGEFGRCVVVSHWRADWTEVDVNRLAIQHDALEKRVEAPRGGDSDPDPDGDSGRDRGRDCDDHCGRYPERHPDDDGAARSGDGAGPESGPPSASDTASQHEPASGPGDSA